MLHFIVNRLSGKGRGAIIAEQIKEYLNARRVAYDIHFTEYHLHAEELAREVSALPDCEGVIAVGGDGTFNEVLCGTNPEIPYGAIPAGSGNDFMRTFAPEKSVEAILEDIINGRTRKIDYIEVNGRRSINSTGTGMDVDILLRNIKYRRLLSGSACYFAALIVTLFNLKFRNFEYSVDGGEAVKEKCLILAVANGRYFGGGLPVSLTAELDDGLLDVLLIKKMPFYRVPDLLIKFLKGTIRNNKKYVHFFQCKTFECAISPDSEIQLDGEIHSMPKFLCRIHPAGLTVFG